VGVRTERLRRLAQLAILLLVAVSCTDDRFSARYAQGVCAIDSLCHFTDSYDESFCHRHERSHFEQAMASCKEYHPEFEEACLDALDAALDTQLCTDPPSVHDDTGPCALLLQDCGRPCWPFMDGSAQTLGRTTCPTELGCYWDSFFGFPDCVKPTVTAGESGAPCAQYADCKSGLVCSAEDGTGTCATWCTALNGGVYEAPCPANAECVPFPGGEGFFGHCRELGQ
jgi:hypothetical protein